jgi:hypothetical protein
LLLQSTVTDSTSGAMFGRQLDMINPVPSPRAVDMSRRSEAKPR